MLITFGGMHWFSCGRKELLVLGFVFCFCFFSDLFSSVLLEGLDIFILGPKNSSNIGK